MKLGKLFLLGFLIFSIIGCSREADVASRNISYEADNFQILRRVVFFNGITDKYLLEIVGFCSINKDNRDNQLEVTCKTADGYKKHYFGLSDNTAYFLEQIKTIKVSGYYYKVNFRPQSLTPSIDLDITTKMPEYKVKVTNDK